MRPALVRMLCLALALSGTACGGGEESLPAPGEKSSGSKAPAKGPPKAGASASASAGAETADLPPLPTREFGPDDFVESEESRDPFRDFSHLFAPREPEERVVQRPVKASQFALDQLKLNGIVGGGAPSVMLTDPSGFGWIVHTGEYVGKAEMVNVGGTDGTEVPINWKVDRIAEDRVVFIREDNTRPEIPPVTRVMPLYPAGDPGSRG